MEPLRSVDLELEAFPIVALAVLGVVASVGILSNAAILITVWTDRRLRNATCWFICSLAAADIVILTCVVPFAAIQDLAGHWPYEDNFCDVWIVFDLTFSVASLLSILLVAIDKYLMIKMPFTYSQRMNTKLVALVLAGTWIFAFSTIIVPVAFGHLHVDGVNCTHAELPKDHEHHMVFRGECLAKFAPAYSLMLSLLDFVLPCAAMTVIYTKLFLRAKLTVDEIKAVRISLECNYASSQQAGAATRIRTEFKAAFTIALIMGTYLFCWLPFFALQIWSSFDESCCDDSYFKAAIWLGYVNSVANPLIYGFMDRKIRAALKKLMWRASISSMPVTISVREPRESKESRESPKQDSVSSNGH